MAEAVNAYARGLGAARSGDATGARREADRLSALRDVLATAKQSYWAEQTEIQRQVVLAWATRVEGQHEEALTAHAQGGRARGQDREAPGHARPDRSRTDRRNEGCRPRGAAATAQGMSSRRRRAARRSPVAKPSVNQPWTPASSRSRVSVPRPALPPEPRQARRRTKLERLLAAGTRARSMAVRKWRSAPSVNAGPRRSTSSPSSRWISGA